MRIDANVAVVADQDGTVVPGSCHNDLIGIRVAIGGRPGEIVALLVREGMGRVGIGVAVGILLALVATKPLTVFLYGVRPSDPLAFAVIAAILTVVALVATYLPARHALRINPIAQR